VHLDVGLTTEVVGEEQESLKTGLANMELGNKTNSSIELERTDINGEIDKELYNQLKIKEGLIESERSRLDQELKESQQTLKSKDDIIKRKEFLLNRALKSVHELEAAGKEKDRLMSEKENGWKQREMEDEKKSEQWEELQKNLKDLKEQVTI